MSQPIDITKELFLLAPYYLGAPCYYIKNGKEHYETLSLRLLQDLVDKPYFEGKVSQLTFYLKDVNCLTDKEFEELIGKMHSEMSFDSLDDLHNKIKNDAAALFYLMNLNYDVFGLVERGLAESQKSEEYKRCTGKI
jgi:hypothetical protein